MTRAVTAQDKPRPVPGRIGGVLVVVNALIAYARHFAATAAERVAVPEFAGVAAVFGTYELPVILHRLRRGLLRALALQQYLLERAARGRNLRFAWPNTAALQPHHRPPAKPATAPRPAPAAKRQPDLATLGPDDPAAYRMPSQQELEAWARRIPVGRAVAYICMDIGLVPRVCEGAFWNRVANVLRRYGGNLDRMCRIRERREKEFQRERDRRPETWHIDWREMTRETLRQVLGCLVGETPPTDGPATGLPSIVPS